MANATVRTCDNPACGARGAARYTIIAGEAVAHVDLCDNCATSGPPLLTLLTFATPEPRRGKRPPRLRTVDPEWMSALPNFDEG